MLLKAYGCAHVIRGVAGLLQMNIMLIIVRFSHHFGHTVIDETINFYRIHGENKIMRKTWDLCCSIGSIGVKIITESSIVVQ